MSKRRDILNGRLTDEAAAILVSLYDRAAGLRIRLDRLNERIEALRFCRHGADLWNGQCNNCRDGQ